MSTHATGPRTNAGKERSSANAATHGLCSERPVLPCEDADAWNAFHDAMIAELEPVGLREQEYAGRIALHHWRLRRVARFELTVGTDQYKAATGKVIDAMFGFRPDEPMFQKMLQANRDLESAKEELEGVNLTRTLLQQLPTLSDAAVIDPDDVLYMLDLLGQSANRINEPVTAEILRRELPKTAQKSWPETLAFLTAAVAEDIRATEESIASHKKRFEKAAEAMAVEIEAQGHDHQLLHGAEMDRLVRYEAHVHRLLRRDQEALDQLQEKRRERAAATAAAPPVRSAETAAPPSVPEAIARRSQLPPEPTPTEPNSFRSYDDVLAALAQPPRSEPWPGRAPESAREFVPQISAPHRNGTSVMPDSAGSS